MNRFIHLKLVTTVGLLILLMSSFVGDVQERPIAPSFTLDNMEGKKVSLNDFKGKVVYIDFWATWCGPCLAEMPHSKKLREKFAGDTNVVFMYVSVDNSDSEDAWKAVVKKKEIVGVNLIARNGGEEERVGERYGLQYIPRFVLIDKTGKVANFEAPTPGDSKTELLIKQLLAE
ncbi:TlpA disulfide reductase family protein [uncultured Cytophaga sp.]|uniref:TlpA family protein disulfide reductase n=1 Tax=uncultured Cytophaga sp. TaxID=160238 RepID=UPI0026172F8A|nr:TlpA disulfide reductase family protein [uncultured Cytophaga sp.]